MHPFFMGTEDHRLFAAYDPPVRDSIVERAVVLCPAWGSEYLNSHRAMRQLALMLSSSGCHVLRFDWYGTGDSGGDAGEVSTWTGDLNVAIDELVAVSGVNRTWLVGLRLGAAMAAKTVGNRSDIAGVVLWDPVIDGAEYLTECLAMHAEIEKESSGLQRFADGTEFLEVLGHPLPVSLGKEIKSIDTALAMSGWSGRVDVIVSDDRPSYRNFCARLAEHGVGHTYTVIESPPAWVEDLELFAGKIPLRLLRSIEDWIR